MIRLTLNAQSDPEIHLFNKSTLLLGSDPNQVDLLLCGPEIQSIHLKIIDQNGFPVLINIANDPFVSVNHHPFGKKLLNSGDLIIVHQITILFENLNAEENAFDSSKEGTLVSLLENKIRAQEETPPSFIGNIQFSSFSLPFEKEVEGLKEDELHQTSIESYLKELESTHESLKQSSPSVEQSFSKERKKITSLKDDYLKDLDDDNRDHKASSVEQVAETSHLYQAWKWILIFIFSLLAISGVMGIIIYFTLSDKTEAQETKAAQGVADIVIALAHAQLNHLKPHNQNWSDVDFLKSNLQAVLPDTNSYASQIDAQGQFNCCPYNLRIYTSSDLSHFLLIAQPDPYFLYWLIPQSIIVVDSNLMELRTLKDIRSLNRLLANPNPLDGPNGKEITSLIKQGELIRLSNLAQDSGLSDFAPPKNLGWMRPGAENLIYNAPRYYRLGQTIIQKAINLSTLKGSSQEVANLKQDIENSNWLHHLILYSDQGKKSALLARQGFSMFAPSDNLLFGYLLFNAQGKIHQVHLLKDEEGGKDSSMAYLSKEKEGDFIHLERIPEARNKEEIKKNIENSVVDHNHPIYIQLQALAHARENELKPLLTALSALMNQELQTPRPQFQIEFQNLSHVYLMANAKHKQILKENLDALYHKYEEMPIHQFLAFIKELHLNQLIQQEDQTLTIIDENCQQNMETLLTQIESSKSLVELDNFIRIATTWLNLDYIKDPQELMKYQNLLRNQLLEQLEKYLLSRKKHFLVKSDDREALEDILNQQHFIQPEEKDFFLREFDESLATQLSHETEEQAKAY